MGGSLTLLICCIGYVSVSGLLLIRWKPGDVDARCTPLKETTDGVSVVSVLLVLLRSGSVRYGFSATVTWSGYSWIQTSAVWLDFGLLVWNHW